MSLDLIRICIFIEFFFLYFLIIDLLVISVIQNHHTLPKHLSKSDVFGCQETNYLILSELLLLTSFSLLLQNNNRSWPSIRVHFFETQAFLGNHSTIINATSNLGQTDCLYPLLKVLPCFWIDFFNQFFIAFKLSSMASWRSIFFNRDWCYGTNLFGIAILALASHLKHWR